MRLRLAIAIAFAFVAGCTLGAGSFAGKTCDSQADCPAPYVCAQVRPGGTSCELLHGIDSVLGTGDGGTGGGGGGGGSTLPPDWCHDVSPIVMRTCVSNCHGTDHSYTGSPTNFQLNVYSSMGGTLGAFDEAASMSVQVQVGLMPPVGIDPRPTAQENLTIINWAMAGAVECNPDAGG